MPVGRPISLTPNVATQSFTVTATAGQTSFTVTNGYRLNELGVYRNGVRLIQGKDFTASDGSTVTLLSGAVVDDVIEFQIFDSFNIADALVSYGNQSISGNLTVTKIIGDGSELTGIGTDNINTNNIKVSGISTLGTETTVVGSAVTFDASGGTIVGVLTATSFSGDGSSLTGVANTDYIDAASLTVSGIATFNGVGNFDAEVTAAGGVDVTGGVKSAGIVSFTNTTASTSTTTGALIVSGGVGIAGSLHVGENVSVGGTLTYEDVTNIDSVGVVTAQLGVIATAGRGVQITAGGLNVTAGIATFKNEVDADGGVDIAGGLKVAGIATFGGADIKIDGSAVGVTSVTWDASANYLNLKDSSMIVWGDSQDLKIYHDGSHAYIANTTGNLILQGKYGESSIKCEPDGQVTLWYDNALKFQTTNDGTVTTGIATASSFTDDKGKLRSIPANWHNAATYTLVASDAGKFVSEATSGANITVPASVFSTGDAITIMNHNGGNTTITQGTGVTMYWTADGTTGNRTLATRGLCTILYREHNVCYISGGGLT